MDRKQAEALKALLRKWTGDAVQFRFLVTVILMLVIVFLVELPLADQLASARTRQREALAMSTLSHDVKGYVEQIELYDPHVAMSTELVDWQGYVMAQLEHTTATLISLEPKGVEAKGVFQVLSMELVAKGSSYREFVDFIERLEHGERLMRVEKLRLEKHQTTIFITCQIKGLVKSAAAAAGSKGAKGAATIFGPPSPFAAAAARPAGTARDAAAANAAATDAAPGSDDEIPADADAGDEAGAVGPPAVPAPEAPTPDEDADP